MFFPSDCKCEITKMFFPEAEGWVLLCFSNPDCVFLSLNIRGDMKPQRFLSNDGKGTAGFNLHRYVRMFSAKASWSLTAASFPVWPRQAKLCRRKFKTRGVEANTDPHGCLFRLLVSKLQRLLTQTMKPWGKICHISAAETQIFPPYSLNCSHAVSFCCWSQS